jgi:cystathionine gamma-synthase
MYRDRASALARLHPATRAVLAGRPRQPGEALNQPPVFASAFASAGEGSGYARHSNPTWEAFEAALGSLDGGSAVAFGSGMAAAAAVIDALPTGAEVLVGDSAYLEVRRVLADRQRLGRLRVTEIDPLATDPLMAALRGADLLWLDAIANPMLEVPELDRILPAARRAGALSVVDSTLATPVLLRPIELGADVVVHSATKYVGGHSDLMLGVAVARDPHLAARLHEARTAGGSLPGTMEAWLGLRGMRTLPLRIERGAATAALLAARLDADERVGAVRYPGLASHPSHETASRLLGAHGAVLSFEVAGAARADDVCEAVEVITHAGSLGGVETLIERQARWHGEASVPDGLLRLSVGCEAPEDLRRDLSSALAA